MDNLNIDQNLSFSAALEAVKNGKQIARKGWNGKNMFVFLNIGSVDNAELNDPEKASTHINAGDGRIRIDLFDKGAEGTVTRLPNLNMKSASGSTVTGWLASQTDLLAEDWNILN